MGMRDGRIIQLAALICVCCGLLTTSRSVLYFGWKRLMPTFLHELARRNGCLLSLSTWYRRQVPWAPFSLLPLVVDVFLRTLESAVTAFSTAVIACYSCPATE